MPRYQYVVEYQHRGRWLPEAVAGTRRAAAKRAQHVYAETGRATRVRHHAAGRWETTDSFFRVC
jgi:hypothetical protein